MATDHGRGTATKSGATIPLNRRPTRFKSKVMTGAHDDTRRDPNDLTACTCASLRQAARVVTQVYDAALRPVGLKATQFTVLAAADKSGVTPMTRLAGALLMDRTTLTRNLKPLIKAGCIAVTSDADHRIRNVRLTETGRRLLDRARPHWEAAQARLADAFGVDKWSDLLADLAAVASAARRT